ncbi:MAG: preprotein translocase subunit SecG [Leptospiraceae bacterium]|nr:preprotein translocase subunit SecG [Leptospiraceae bacterium]MCB1201020.1 preprotein translocase subunit SecG [Leptospiraceae bacterium]
MGILSTVLTVLFVVVSVILILLILVQSNRSSGMGFLGSASQTAFGSSSGDILTKMTAGLATAFMVMALLMAMIMSKKTDTSELQKEISGTSVPAEASPVIPGGSEAPTGTESTPQTAPGTQTP